MPDIGNFGFQQLRSSRHEKADRRVIVEEPDSRTNSPYRPLAGDLASDA
jgi:hypothetical protein